MSVQAVPHELTIDSLQQGYRARAFTPQEVMEAVILRAERDREMNIWITSPSLENLAPYLERLQELEPAEHPLWGIPFAVKDNIAVAGWPVTAACPAYAFTPQEYAGVVARLVSAGAIPVGKTNLDQFATGLVGTRSPYGDTHNALLPELISGGSSSGSAVAVARGQAAFALGTDTAGSGRVPAALNRLVGYKPAVGAWPLSGVVPACRSIDCVNVFAHHIQDAAVADSILRGRDPDDPFSVDRPLGRAASPQVWLLPKGPLSFYGPFAHEYEQAWERTRDLLQLHFAVEEMDISLLQEAAALLYEGPLVAERWSDLGDFVEGHRGEVFPVTEKILRTGAKAEFSAAALFQAQHRLAEIKHIIAKALSGAVLLLPTCGGTWSRAQVQQDPIGTNNQMGLYTNHCNLLDLSAVAVPSVDAGPQLPFGVTLFSVPEEEGQLTAAAAQFRSLVEVVTVAVCGLHMRGFALEPQMTGLGAVFLEESRTSPTYELYRLPTVPPKPGLVRVAEGGASIAVELWSMPQSSLGAFTAGIPGPLGIGKIELDDGRIVSGFICEAYGTEGAVNLTEYGGWRKAMDMAKA
ncbi:allophanate hydrolase [Paenibacillus sp. F411]|uniref:allophanate hydrolase n=1 Tax=Paenibacillus sp. F411 TaxID=2820239 RepID=UPI001AB017D6|nr:allophanate hydrolase [Paenibacillus sp. F411]MBO2945177.1 allophanate hydrolase [Paenibacillus sp. F411]